MNVINKLKSISRIEYINYLIFFYSFTLSFHGQIKRVTILLLVIFWLTDKDRFKFENVQKNILIIFTVFLLYCLASFLWTNATFNESLDYIRRYWYLLPIFIIIKYLKKENLKVVISFFLLGVFTSEIMSYGNYFEVWQIGKGTASNPTVYMYHIFYSMFLAITSLILIIKIFLEKELKYKALYFLFFITVTFNLLINIGRTGQVSLILTLMIITSLYLKTKVRYIFAILTAVTLTLLLNYNLNSNFKNRTDLIKSDLEKAFLENDYNTSIGGRLGFWILSKEILSDDKKLFLGVGLNEHLKESKKIVDEKYPELFYNKELSHFHSNYLEILTQFGLIGLSLFLLILYKIATIKIIDTEIKFLKISTVSIFALSSIVDVPFYKDVTLSLFTLLFALVLTQYKYENRIKI